MKTRAEYEQLLQDEAAEDLKQELETGKQLFKDGWLNCPVCNRAVYYDDWRECYSEDDDCLSVREMAEMNGMSF